MIQLLSLEEESQPSLHFLLTGSSEWLAYVAHVV